jgi:hypothetical protein
MHYYLSGPPGGGCSTDNGIRLAVRPQQRLVTPDALRHDLQGKRDEHRLTNRTICGPTARLKG